MGSARLNALGGRGALKAVQAPLTPRPRGTIYEALPFIVERVWEGPRWRLHSKHCGSLSVCKLTAIARRPRPGKGFPNHSASGPRGRFAVPWKKEQKPYFCSHLSETSPQFDALRVSPQIRRAPHVPDYGVSVCRARLENIYQLMIIISQSIAILCPCADLPLTFQADWIAWMKRNQNNE